MLTNAPKGTKDMMPDQAFKWQYVEKKFREICRTYGFKEIRTPAFEHTELFTRGVGDTTDIVEKQMYTFTDYAKRSITLKPEGTSPAVRAFVEHKQYAEVQPTKLYYETPCFRYEKPQSGRLREFHQFGVEVFGTANMLADAEVISLANDFLNELGIKNTELRINSIGCPNCREKHRAALREFLLPKYDQLCNTCKSRFDKNPMRILDCKSEICQQLVKGAPVMLDYLCDDCRDAFSDLQKNLKAMGIPFTVDPGIVRGLDYYTKTAFEFVSTDLGAQSTVCGGGRYDNLIEELGGPPIPGVGFGLGIERLLIILDEYDVWPEKESGADAFIAIMGDKAKAEGLALASRLRKQGFSVEIDLLARNFKGQFKYANRLNAAYAIVIGDEEVESGKLTVKDMATSEQTQVDAADIEAYLGERVRRA